MHTNRVLRSATIGLLAGYAGSKVMDPVTTRLQAVESEPAKRREEAVSPGVAYTIAARKTAAVAGFDLNDKQAEKAGIAMHYGLALAGGELYAALRRGTDLNPVSAGLLVGLGLWAVVDEGANWAFGFSAPPQDYPAETHLRGLAGHVALGLGTAVAAEALGWLTRD